MPVVVDDRASDLPAPLAPLGGLNRAHGEDHQLGISRASASTASVTSSKCGSYTPRTRASASRSEMLRSGGSSPGSRGLAVTTTHRRYSGCARTALLKTE